MSEVDARTAPTRGRTSTRGGRGGFGRGGPRGGAGAGTGASHRTLNGTVKDIAQAETSTEDSGELGELKSKYGASLGLLKDMFPDWTDVDLVFALQETDGDLPLTIERISEGHVSQFSEIRKPKDRAKSKVKEAPTFTQDLTSGGARPGRGRGGAESTRGGRGRGADRGRGGFRGVRGGSTAVHGASVDTTAPSVPTTESSAWDTPTTAESSTAAAAAAEPVPTAPPASSQPELMAVDSTPAAASEGAISSLIPDGVKKSWASMFAKPVPKAAPALPKQAIVPPPVPAELAATEQAPTQETSHIIEHSQEPERLPSPAAEEQPAEAEPNVDRQPTESLEQTIDEPAPGYASQVPLTEGNLEHLPDSSAPPATFTAASTVGSMDPRGTTPSVLSQQPPIGRPPMGGYAASASRAAATPARSASFQRKLHEQQEAVVMPGHSVVDRATVQFGSMGLNGDSDALDVDDAREEAETRTQPPQQSPAQPRASLPPAARQTMSQDSYAPEPLPTPKQAPGLPPASYQQHSHATQHDSNPLSSLQHGQDSQQSAQSYSQYGRYGESDVQPEAAAPAQKAYDPFSHQTPSSSFDQYSAQSHLPSSQQQQGFGAFSSAPSDYSQYYTSDQQRNPYQSYYGGSYGQQSGQAQQDAGAAQQRTASGFGSGPAESSYPASQGQHQSQSRYNEAPGSGNNTPNPALGGQQQSSGPSQQQMQQQQHQASQYNSSYPYGHPYYNSPYHAAYQNQFGYSGQIGYGQQPFGAKGGMYGQPHGYGMNPQSSYDQHSSQSGSAGAFNQQSSMQSRDSGLSGGLGDYGRTSSAQPSQHTLGSGGLGGMSDSFGRTQSGYQGQSQGPASYSQQQSNPADDLKPFGDSKVGGPASSVGGGGQPGRPGSATNSIGGQTQSSLPPPQSHQQQSFGGYPGFNQNSQYGGLGGVGQQQQQQQQQHQGGYQGGYGQSGFGNTYGQQYGRGGWGQSGYGH